MSYYHWTCRHSAEGIDAAGGALRLSPQPVLGRLPMLWFTTQRSVTRGALGLSSVTLGCDRMERLYQVVDEDEHLVIPWWDLKALPEFAGHLAGARRLEAVRGTRPGLWAVALEPVRVLALT